MSILRKLKSFFKKKSTPTPYYIYEDTEIQYITDFKDGYALALMAESDGFKFKNNDLYVAVLDTNYNIAMKTPYISFGKWSNGYLIAYNQNYEPCNSAVLLNAELREVPNVLYSRIWICNDCFNIVLFSESQYFNGLLDKNLKMVLPIIYTSISPISNCRFFCEGATNIVYDETINYTYPVPFVRRIYSENSYGGYKFRDNHNLYGYFNNEFEIMIEPKYRLLGDFDKTGFAPFERDGILGVIDQMGNELIR